MADEMHRGTLAAPVVPDAVAPASGIWRPAERPMLDRQSERRAIDDTLDLVRTGFCGGLVLRGGHGVGKTTLLDYAINSAVGFQICVVVGVESEIELEFATLHQLLIPFLPDIDDLPAPQGDAVKIAFGLETGRRPDPFLVALGCLTLVSRPRTAQCSAPSTTRTGSMPSRLWSLDSWRVGSTPIGSA
jgi:hypothetical protein